MPNWCSNYLNVRGPEGDIALFKKLIRSRTDILDTFYPRPTGASEEMVTNETHVSSFGWSVDHWGTKWDIDVEVLHETIHELQLQFDSAWSPPTPGVHAISFLCPRLRFELKYEECGCDFSGLRTYIGGLCVQCEDEGAQSQEIDDPENPGESIDNPEYVELRERWRDADDDRGPDEEQQVELRATKAGIFAGYALIEPCKHCKGFPEEHVNKQCLFGSTTYQPYGGFIQVARWIEEPVKWWARARVPS